MGFPHGSPGNKSACNSGDLGLIPGLGRSPGEGKGYPLQYYGLENSMDCIDHGVTKSGTRLSDFHFHFSPTVQQNYTQCFIIIYKGKESEKIDTQVYITIILLYTYK